MTIAVELTQGHCAFVDAEDFEWLSKHSWCFLRGNYAVRSRRMSKDRSDVETLYMAREILEQMLGRELLSSEEVDHISGDRLDNRRLNLRVASSSQNKMNRRKANGKSSKFIGVCWDKSREQWMARIKIDGKPTHIGRFDSELEAAERRDDAAVELHGEFAKLNFPRLVAV